MKLKGKRSYINVAMNMQGNTRSVPALVFGPYLALHKTVNGFDWTVTHLPTGFHILTAQTQREGRLLIAQLFPLDWSTRKAAQANGPAVRRIANGTSWSGE